MSKLKLLSSVMIISLSVSGCLSGKQPPRHNTVVGEKRVPNLNPQTAQPPVPFPTEEMLYQMPQTPQQGGLQTRTSWSNDAQPMSAPMANPAIAQNGMPQPTSTNGTTALQPSPLQYYEQQNAQVAATQLQPSPIAQSEAKPPIASSVPLNDVAKNDAIINSEPINAPEINEVQANEAKVNEEYPKLNDIPEKKATVAQEFKDAKSAAKDFSEKESTKQSELKEVNLNEPLIPEFKELTLDEFLDEKAPVAKNPEVAKSEVKNPEISPVVPSEDVPSNPQATDNSTKSLPEVEQQSQPIQAETPLQNSPLDSPSNVTTQQTIDPVAPEAAAISPELEKPTANVDFTKQPLQEVVLAPEAPVAKLQDSPIEPTTEATQPAPIAESPSEPIVAQQPKIDPFADENSKREIMEEMAAQPVIAPQEPAQIEPVVVKDAAPVAVTPSNQRIYTSSGPIELIPPSSISSRGGTIPRSRYYNRRNNYQINRSR